MIFFSQSNATPQSFCIFISIYQQDLGFFLTSKDVIADAIVLLTADWAWVHVIIFIIRWGHFSLRSCDMRWCIWGDGSRTVCSRHFETKGLFIAARSHWLFYLPSYNIYTRKRETPNLPKSSRKQKKSDRNYQSDSEIKVHSVSKTDWLNAFTQNGFRKECSLYRGIPPVSSEVRPL